MAPSKLLLGTLATCLIAIGIAAQTGTIHVARPARTVSHQPAVVPPPQPRIVQPAPPASPAPSPAAAPDQSNGGDQGDGEGD